MPGRARILVMDDEEIVRLTLASMLEGLGYEAELAEDGLQAVGLYKRALEEKRPFDAVIMDLTVKGGMGGRDAIKSLLELDPQVKAIISSGYSEDAMTAGYRSLGFRKCILKPYSIEELRAGLVELLNQD